MSIEKGNAMVLIKKYRISRKGQRGATVTIPPVYLDDLNLKAGDVIKAYRDGDKLILIPEKIIGISKEAVNN